MAWPRLPGFKTMLLCLLLEMRSRSVTQYSEPMVQLTNQLLRCTHLHSAADEVNCAKCARCGLPRPKTPAMEALAVALGPRVLLRYVLQGLFHPARRVRDVYWKLYNTLYILQQDALVPSYPAIEGEPGRAYERTTLELFI